MVIAPEIGIESYISIDLSIQNTSLSINDLRSSSSFSNYINAYLESHSKQIAYGGYLERRLLYSRSIHFNTNINHQRDIHLGIDLWCVVNTAVTAAFCGRIHSFKNNTNFGDYGPTIIIEHQFEEFQFFTLYGHLSLASIVFIVSCTDIISSCSFFPGLKPITLIFALTLYDFTKSNILYDGIFGTTISAPFEFLSVQYTNSIDF